MDGNNPPQEPLSSNPNNSNLVSPVYDPASPSVALSSTVDPGKTLGVVGLILAFFASLIGLILSIVSLVKSRKAGFRGGLGIAGIIVSSLMLVIGTLIAAAIILAAYNGVQKRAQDNLTKLNSSQQDYPQATNDDVISDEPSDTTMNELNKMGTVADVVLQQDIIKSIATSEKAHGTSGGELVVSAIRSQQISEKEYSEEWDIQIDGQKFTYYVDLMASASGGVDYTVTRKN